MIFTVKNCIVVLYLINISVTCFVTMYNSKDIHLLKLTNNRISNKLLLNSKSDNNVNVNEIDDIKTSNELNELLDKLSSYNSINEAPNELNEQLQEKVDLLRPSELEMKMNYLGLTPLSLLGFLIGGVLTFLNLTLGTGWATNLITTGSVYDNVNIESKESIKSIDNDVLDKIKINEENIKY